MSNVKSINGYKVADGDLRNCVAIEFDQANAYDVGDIVLYNNALYRAGYDIPAGTPWNFTLWRRTTVGHALEDLTRDIEGIHFPNGNLSTPIIRLHEHIGETLQLVNQRGFYLVRLTPNDVATGRIYLYQGSWTVYQFTTRNGDEVRQIVYLNTDSYEIIKTGELWDCSIYG